MWLVVLSTLMLLSSATSSKLTFDDINQSGDFDMGINPFKAQQPDARDTSDESITKMFSNHHQKQAKPSNNQRQPTKSKQQNRKADLNEDVNDFIDLIPKAEIKTKLDEYYRNDMDVQHIFEYFHGKEFLELRKNLLDMQDVKETLQYLNKNGLNVKSVLRKVDNRLSISKMRPTLLNYNSQQSFGTNTTIGGVNGLIEDVLGLLPQDEIFILFFEKLDSSPKFAAFVQSIGDPDFHRKYNALWKSKELYSASAQLKKHKIDIVKIIQIVQGFFIFGTF